MAAVRKAAWITLLVMLSMPSTHGLKANAEAQRVAPVFQVDAADWSGGTASWTDSVGGQTSTTVTGVAKETKADRPSVLLNGDSSYVEWGNFKWGTDVYAESSLEVFVYVNSYPNNLNWFAGAMPVTHCMRYILLNDYRVGGAGPSCMAINQGGYGMGALPLNTWVQVVSVYLSDGTEYVVVDGVQSPTRSSSGGSTVGKHLRIGNPSLGGHGPNANAASVRVYGRALTLSEIDSSRAAFLSTATPTPTPAPTLATPAPTPAPTAAPAGSSCKALRDAGHTTDGTYQISVTDSVGTSTSLPLYCDMSNGGWTLIGQISGKHSIYSDWLRKSHNAGNLQSPAIASGTWASIPAVDLAVNHAKQVRFSNQDLSKYVYWDMDSDRTVATWWNHAAGYSAINSAADHQVTVYDQDGTTSTCWQNAYGAMPIQQHGGSYPAANYNTNGNTVPGDRCMAVGVQPSGSADGFSQNGNGYDAPDSDTDWPNTDYTSAPFVNVWVGGEDTTPQTTTSGGGASAVGDPHLQNVHGQRFDLMKAGKHVLISIPRGTSGADALLYVQADARHLGGQCAEMYFQELNITGAWAEKNQAGGYHYSVFQDVGEAPEWIAFGKVELKVVLGHTGSGLVYFNVYAKHLGRAGFAIGGLLGEDDYQEVATPPAGCGKRLSLAAGGNSPSTPSVAVADLA